MSPSQIQDIKRNNLHINSMENGNFSVQPMEYALLVALLLFLLLFLLSIWVSLFSTLALSRSRLVSISFHSESEICIDPKPLSRH